MQGMMATLSGFPAVIGLGQRQVASDRDQDRHEQGGAHRPASAGDGASAPQLAAVMVERGEAGEHGTPAPIDPAEFG